MLRHDSSTPISQPVTKCLSEAKGNDYALHLLSDFNALEQAKKEMMGLNNVILLHPSDPYSVNEMGKGRYVATIFQKGKSFAVVSMGERNFGDKTNPPKLDNLIKMALAKVGIGIQVAPLLKTIRPVFQTIAAPDIDNSSLASFAKTSFFANHLAQPVLDQRPMRELKELFGYISEGNALEVKRMLDANPRLSLAKWKAAKEEEKIITNKAGQRIYVEGKTAYEFALGEEDNEIAAMLRERIVKLESKNEANYLFHKQFPADWEQKEKERWALVFAALDTLTQAIQTAAPGDITSSGYRDYKLTVKTGSNVDLKFIDYTKSLNAILNEVVTTGRHFNPNLLLHLFDTYDKHYADYFGNNWNDPKALFYWQRATGRTQHLMTANLVQTFCDPGGLQGAAEKLRTGVRAARSFKFELYDSINGWTTADFYPLSSSGLGTGFAITTGMGGAGGRCVGMPWRAWGGAAFSRLMSIKNCSHTKLMQHHDLRDAPSKTKTSCSVM